MESHDAVAPNQVATSATSPPEQTAHVATEGTVRLPVPVSDINTNGSTSNDVSGTSRVADTIDTLTPHSGTPSGIRQRQMDTAVVGIEVTRIREQLEEVRAANAGLKEENTRLLAQRDASTDGGDISFQRDQQA